MTAKLPLLIKSLYLPYPAALETGMLNSDSAASPAQVCRLSSSAPGLRSLSLIHVDYSTVSAFFKTIITIYSKALIFPAFPRIGVSFTGAPSSPDDDALAEAVPVHRYDQIEGAGDPRADVGLAAG